MKKCLIITLVVGYLLFMSVGSAVADEKPITVLVNGEPVEFTDIKPILQNGRTLIPLRFISESLGSEVSWNGETQSITITQGEKKIEMQVGVKKALVDGHEIIFEQGPELVNNRAVVPLRFVSEALGAAIEWNGDTRTVEIKSDVKTVVESKRIKEFEGQPFKPSDLPTVNGFALYKSNLPGAEVMYASMNDLPIKIGDYIIYDVEIDDKNIKVKQYSKYKRTIAIRMVENNMLCRQRDFGEHMNTNTFTYNYPIIFQGDDWETDKYIPNKTDLRKVSHFAFNTADYSINPEGEFRLLLIANPLYEGRDKK